MRLAYNLQRKGKKEFSHLPLSFVADAVEEVAASAVDTFVAAATVVAASVAAAASVAGVAAVLDTPAVGGTLAVVGDAVAGAVAHTHYRTTALPSVAAVASIARKSGIRYSFIFVSKRCMSNLSITGTGRDHTYISEIHNQNHLLLV